MPRRFETKHLWDILSPIAFYFVISNTVMFLLNEVWKQTDQNYIIKHMIVTVACLPVVFFYYQKPQKKKKADFMMLVPAAVCGAAFAVALNNLIFLTPLITLSASYQEIAAAFYGNTLGMEILATCVLTPILEETLYRGIVYVRIRERIGAGLAAILSAALFGLMHFNVVQFVYAVILGVLLAYIMEKYGLLAAIVTHASANLISVLNSETGLLSVFEKSRQTFLLETAVALSIAFACIFFLCHRKVL